MPEMGIGMDGALFVMNGSYFSLLSPLSPRVLRVSKEGKLLPFTEKHRWARIYTNFWNLVLQYIYVLLREGRVAVVMFDRCREPLIKSAHE